MKRIALVSLFLALSIFITGMATVTLGGYSPTGTIPEGDITFDWPDFGSGSYSLRVTTLGGGTVLDITNINSSQYFVSGGFGPGTYYWRVKDADEAWGGHEERSFTVQ